MIRVRVGYVESSVDYLIEGKDDVRTGTIGRMPTVGQSLGSAALDGFDEIDWLDDTDIVTRCRTVGKRTTFEVRTEEGITAMFWIEPIEEPIAC